jgi:hypothetical protein
MKFRKTKLVNGLHHYVHEGILADDYQRIHIVRFEQGVNPDLTLMPSKASAAVVPGTADRNVHRGDEATFQQILEKQVAIRVMVNGVFHHFSKARYETTGYSSDFEKGDNVHRASYRGFQIGGPVTGEPRRYRYAHLTQIKPGYPFRLQTTSELSGTETLPFYTITCSPMLIWEQQRCDLREILHDDEELPARSGSKRGVLPPGNLAHLHAPHPRTMIATTINSDLLFVTVDGPPKNFVGDSGPCDAKGLTWEGQVRLLEQLRYVDESLEVRHAANMDGGGSTTLYLHDGERGEIRNRPSDPGRAIGNTLIIFDHSLLDRETGVITEAHREQILKGHAKHRAGFDEAWRLAKGDE